MCHSDPFRGDRTSLLGRPVVRRLLCQNTWNQQIAADKSSTIVFPLPMDLMRAFTGDKKGEAEK